MAWKFLNIGKANSEIERLNAELAKKEKEVAEAKAATAPTAAPAAPKTEDPDGDGDEHMECEACNATGTCAECMGNGKCAECGGEGKIETKGAEARAPKSKAGKLALQLDEANAKLEDQAKSVSSLSLQVSAQKTEIEGLTQKLAGKADEVKIQVSRQAVELQSALGQPAAPAIPETASTAAGTHGELKGIARMRAGIKAQLDKDFPSPNRS